jgi:hypothetical protein
LSATKLTRLTGQPHPSLQKIGGPGPSYLLENERSAALAEVEREKLATFPAAEQEELTEVLTGYGLAALTWWSVASSLIALLAITTGMPIIVREKSNHSQSIGLNSRTCTPRDWPNRSAGNPPPST